MAAIIIIVIHSIIGYSIIIFLIQIFVFIIRAIMASGIFIWSLTTLLGSFMDNFWMFLVMRSFVGIGEASYSTIAPTIISDMFIGDMRSKMLALFYFAIPVGRYRSFPHSLTFFCRHSWKTDQRFGRSSLCLGTIPPCEFFATWTLFRILSMFWLPGYYQRSDACGFDLFYSVALSSDIGQL